MRGAIAEVPESFRKFAPAPEQPGLHGADWHAEHVARCFQSQSLEVYEHGLT